MVNAAANPTINSRTLIQGFNEVAPVRLWPNPTEADAEVVIRAVYRQVLGNAYIMDSERPILLESQLKQGNLSVREFVRQLAKSSFYRDRFFENCPRYRAIELNFKHLLGRAPESFDEMRFHSKILDQAGFEADIDSYLDSDEYQTAFGEENVPYTRGYQTQSGRSLLGFTHLMQLLPSVSSSDQDPASGNQARLTQSLIASQFYDTRHPRSVDDILANVFRPKYTPAPVTSALAPSTEPSLQQQQQLQRDLIEKLRRQLADLGPSATIGAAVTRQSQFASQGNEAESTPSRLKPWTTNPLAQEISDQKALIASLEQQLADARRLAAIGEFRLNKWRRRSF